MKRNTILLAISVLTPLVAFTQSQHQGTIVYSDGHTETGYFNYPDLRNQRDSIHFRSQDSEAEKLLSAHQVKEIHLSEKGEIYVGREVVLDMSQLTEDFRAQYVDSTRKATVFLEKIYSGNRYALYYYRDSKEHYLIEQDGKIVELVLQYNLPTYSSTIRGTSEPRFSRSTIYRAQLLTLIDGEKHRKLKSKIETVLYRRKALVKILKEIDALSGT